MAEKGPKKFSRFMRRGTRGDQVEIGSQVEKRRPGIKNGRKRSEKIFALYAPFPYYLEYCLYYPILLAL